MRTCSKCSSGPTSVPRSTSNTRSRLSITSCRSWCRTTTASFSAGVPVTSRGNERCGMIDSLWFARCQMGLSLAFHIVFAVIGMAMPVMMVVAEAAWLRSGDPVYLDLTKRWAKGTAVFFAVGAVSGTVLSFELGLLWPRFMAFAGSIIGMPFSLEGFAFFLEAIFLGIYLYGWDRISSRAHLWAGVAVAASGAASGVFVVIANAWMNAPTGFELLNGHAVNVDPIAAMA